MKKMTILEWRNKKRNRICLYCKKYVPSKTIAIGLCGTCKGKLRDVGRFDKASRCPLFELNTEGEYADEKV